MAPPQGHEACGNGGETAAELGAGAAALSLPPTSNWAAGDSGAGVWPATMLSGAVGGGGSASVTASGSGATSSSGGSGSKSSSKLANIDSSSSAPAGPAPSASKAAGAKKTEAAKKPPARPPSPDMKRPKRPMTAYNYFFREERQKILDLGLLNYENSFFGNGGPLPATNAAAAAVSEPAAKRSVPALTDNVGGQSPVGGESRNESGQEISGSSNSGGGGLCGKRPLRSDSSSLSSRVEDCSNNGSEQDDGSNESSFTQNMKRPRVTVVGEPPTTPNGKGGKVVDNNRNSEEYAKVIGRVVGQMSSSDAGASVSALSSSAPSSHGGSGPSSASDSSIIGNGFSNSENGGTRTSDDTFKAFFSFSSSSTPRHNVDGSEAGTSSTSGNNTSSISGCGSSRINNSNQDTSARPQGASTGKDENAPTPPPAAARTGKKRKRPPPHGKVSFQALGLVIAKRWKQVSKCSELDKYTQMAERDKKRYRKEMKKYDRAVVAAACMNNAALRAAHASEGRPAFNSMTRELSSDSSSSDDGKQAAAKKQRKKPAPKSRNKMAAPAPKRGALRKEAEAVMKAMNHQKMQTTCGDHQQASALQQQQPTLTPPLTSTAAASAAQQQQQQSLHHGFASMPTLATVAAAKTQAQNSVQAQNQVQAPLPQATFGNLTQANLSAAAAAHHAQQSQAQRALAPTFANLTQANLQSAAAQQAQNQAQAHAQAQAQAALQMPTGNNTAGNSNFPALTPQQLQMMGALQGLITGAPPAAPPAPAAGVPHGFPSALAPPAPLPPAVSLMSQASTTLPSTVQQGLQQQPPAPVPARGQTLDLAQALRLGFLAGLNAGGGIGSGGDQQPQQHAAAAPARMNGSPPTVTDILAQLAAGGQPQVPTAPAAVHPGVPVMMSNVATDVSGMDGFLAAAMATALQENQQQQQQIQSQHAQNQQQQAQSQQGPSAPDAAAAGGGTGLHRHTSHRSRPNDGDGGNQAQQQQQAQPPPPSTATQTWTMGTINGNALETQARQQQTGIQQGRSPPDVSDMSGAALSDVVSALSDSSRDSWNGGSLAPMPPQQSQHQQMVQSAPHTLAGGGQQQQQQALQQQVASSTAGSTAAYLANQQNVSSSLGAGLLMQRFLQSQLFMVGNQQSNQVSNGQARTSDTVDTPQQAQSPTL